jgi:hypothetical protein
MTFEVLTFTINCPGTFASPLHVPYQVESEVEQKPLINEASGKNFLIVGPLIFRKPVNHIRFLVSSSQLDDPARIFGRGFLLEEKHAFF